MARPKKTVADLEENPPRKGVLIYLSAVEIAQIDLAAGTLTRSAFIRDSVLRRIQAEQTPRFIYEEKETYAVEREPYHPNG